MDVNDRSQPALFAKLANEPHDLARRLWIKRCCRLIHQKQGGVLNERPANADTLTLASRQLVRTLVCHMREADAVEQAKGLVHI